MSTDNTTHGEGEPPEAPGAADRAADNATAPVDDEKHTVLDFPVVGIGASAGGLEAFAEFFDAMPPATGMAFVLVQHLPPAGESLLAEILQRHTTMPVMQVEDGVAVQPNHVYVIRPGNTLTIEAGRLRLGDSTQELGHRRPVDDFFRSLAAEQKEKAIVLILSGMGSNGSAGAQAIKAAGGICIAQDPITAPYSSMPRSLIDAGYADHVLSISEMPGALVKYAEHPYVDSTLEQRIDIDTQLHRDRRHFNEVLAILRTQTGRDFRGYKRPTLLRRMQRRMGLTQVGRLVDYAAHLRRRPDEVNALADDLTINVTGFFRDAEAWEALRTQVVRPLIAAKANGGTIRAWVAGCSSGEEAYTLAMVLAEERASAGIEVDIKIFATDTAEKTLQHARAGLYPAGIEGDIDSDRIARHFDKDDHSLRIKREIREMLVFAPQNLLADPPFSRLHLVTCRNLLIYLEPEMQRRVIALAHFALREGGTLFLGSAETVGSADDMFVSLNKKWRIYRRVGATRRTAVGLPVTMPPPFTTESPEAGLATRPSLGGLIQRILTERYGPPSVVIDRRNRVVYFHGATDRYVVNPTGEPTRILWELIRDEVRGATRAAVRQAVEEKKSVTVVEGRVKRGKGLRRVYITVSPLEEARLGDYYLISFAEDPETLDVSIADKAPELEANGSGSAVGAPAESESELERELRTMREALQNTIEELESSNEELKASNEEVTSVNEELQSTNEELETSKEELQSLNEELTTVNAQLQSKIEELEGTTNDLTNLLGSTDIAVVFLDTGLRVRRFTPAVRDLFDLIQSDVGRPIADLAQKFVGGDLMAEAAAVLDKLIPIESEIRSSSGRTYTRRTLPYRTIDNRIGGVVVTFFDVTERKRSEDAVLAARRRLSAVIEQMPGAVLIADAQSGRVVLGNKQAADLFGQPQSDASGEANWSTPYGRFQGFHPDKRPYAPHEWPLARSLRDGELVSDEEIRFRRSDGTEGVVAVNATPVHDAEDRIIAAVATFWNISERKEEEQALRDSEERFRLLIEGTRNYAILLVGADGTILTWNRGAETLFGWPAVDAVNRPWSMIFTPEDRARRPETELREALRDSVVTFDHWFLRSDGSRFWGSGVMTALQAEDGSPRGFLKILRDTTDRMKAEESSERAREFADSRRQLAEDSNRAKEDFIATVSHELRTPLSAMLIWAEMFRAGKVPDHMRQEGMEILERAARTQQRLIDDLLDVSRMGSGKLRLSLRPTRLSNAVEAGIEAALPAAEGRRVQVRRDIASDIGVVRADPDRIQQIVWNLLSNAVKFTPSGGKVTVSLTREGANVVLQVSDTGIGISQELLPRVFDRFRQGQTGTTRQHGGLGLGLAIARQLVELHGGTITCTSPGEGKGSTFVARLPFPAQAGAVAIDRITAPTHDGQLAARHVLVVEDEETTRNSLEALLRTVGAEVTAVDSAAAALEAFGVRRPDVIVSDIAMQDEDGYSLMTRLRKLERRHRVPPVPALALTALAREDDRQRAFAAGFSAYEAKPIDPDRLVSVLAALANPE